MRRLRSFLPFAGRIAVPVGEATRSDCVGTKPGRVDRRRLLGLIVAAPIAAPTLARAAVRKPVSEWVTTWESGAPGVLSVTEGGFTALSDLSSRVISRSDVIANDGLASTKAQDDLMVQIERYRADVLLRRAALVDTTLPVPTCLPFTDDVGSGP